MKKNIATLAKPLLGTLVGLTATWGLVGLGSAAVAADVSTLESGTYFAQGSMYSRSYRVFRTDHDAGRACVKIADGPPNPYEGYQNITISTITGSEPQPVVAATKEEFIVRGPQEFVIGSGQAGVWKLVKNVDADFSAGLSACMAAPGRYTKQWRGQFVTGRIEPNVPGELVSQQPKAQINVRQEAGGKSAIAHYGVAGDKVMLMDSRRDASEKMWYRVKFVDSKAEGWVRSDFVRAPGRSASL
jgi:Bacterial SH3 domain